MDVNTITQLANVIRNYGDKIVNGQSKFTLSTSLLENLNRSFNLHIERNSSTFQIRNNSIGEVELYSDLQFLNGVVKKSASLKLIPDISRENKDVVDLDISSFSSLKLLEIYKVDVESVQGIQSLRAKLNYLVCVRSLRELKDVLEYCGADKSDGFVWSELKEAVFCYNGITNLDSSLEFSPWLRSLDLSHNSLQNADVLNSLSNLKQLNLSFNKLEEVPEFAGQICSRLQVLCLKNNFIEDIKNVSSLINLCELDLGDNCILEHTRLAPLSYLATLNWLNLEGNPLSYHTHHRPLTIPYLHVNTTTVQFRLDRLALYRSEQKLAGQFTHTQRVLLSSFSSVTSDQTVTDRPRRVRNAVIAENTEEATPSPISSLTLTSSLDHLETRRQIKELRAKYGESWLQQQAGNMVQDALGMDKTAFPVTSSPYEKDFLLHAAQVHVDTSGKFSNNTFTTAPESVVSDNSLYAGENEVVESSSDEEVDLGEGEESLYLAKNRDEPDEEVFLVVTKTRLSERECITSKERAYWPYHSLSKCEIVNGEPDYVKLEFSTLRRDRRLREYVLDDRDEMFRLVAVLQKVISTRPPEKRKRYKCMKCSTQFEKADNGSTQIVPLECPACKGRIVIEDDS